MYVVCVNITHSLFVSQKKRWMEKILRGIKNKNNKQKQTNKQKCKNKRQKTKRKKKEKHKNT